MTKGDRKSTGSFVAGQEFSRFRIREEIGAGGMGVVYRAFDTRLARDVAIKVLPDRALTDDESRRRFRKEALSLSRINHPNIEIVHDFDAWNGVDFLVMEYIGGATLKARLSAGPLSRAEILDLGRQLTEGLSAAHERGVIHGDLKPSNLILTDENRLKILDFGLATILRPPTSTATTQSLPGKGPHGGTMPYMSPEQLRGDRLDPRTDVYSAGATLYEMATGSRPFRQSVVAGLVEAVLHQPPVPPRDLNPGISKDLSDVILKCLEKKKEDRFGSVRELHDELKRIADREEAGERPRSRSRWPGLAAGVLLTLSVLVLVFAFRDRLIPGDRGSPDRIILGVLPFVNLSEDPDQDYFSDGLTEEMIAQLGRINPQRLGVLARTTMMQVKAGGSIPHSVAELGIDYLLEGSVRLSEDRVRVRAQLFRGGDQTQVWSRDYDEEPDDILVLQSEVAREIAREIRIQLVPSAAAGVGGPLEVNPDAHDAYLRGRYFWNKRTSDGLTRSVAYFRAAIDIDPDYAAAWAGLADAYLLFPVYDMASPEETYSKAEEAARTALRLDGGLAEAHASLACSTFLYEWDWENAEEGFRTALEINPSYATGHQWYGLLLMAMGRFDEARDEIRRALELDPLSIVINDSLGSIYFYSRQFDQAVEQFRKTLELDPGFAISRVNLANVLSYLGRNEAALDEYRTAIETDPDSPEFLASLGSAYARMGREKDARDILARLTALSRNGSGPPSAVIYLLASLGETDQAIDLLEKAFRERDTLIPWIKVDPSLDPIRPSPRFQVLLEKMHFPA